PRPASDVEHPIASLDQAELVDHAEHVRNRRFVAVERARVAAKPQRRQIAPAAEATNDRVGRPRHEKEARAESAVGPVRDSIDYLAPLPDNTAGTVFNRIFRSRSGDHVSMYLRSSAIQRSKSSSLLPDTCQRQVRPGFIESRRRCHGS